MRKAPAVGPGLGELITKEADSSPSTRSTDSSQIDPRLAFLACAAARFDLVEAGVLSIGEAVDPEFIENFRRVFRLVCYCERRIMGNFGRVHGQDREAKLRAWRRS